MVTGTVVGARAASLLFCSLGQRMQYLTYGIVEGRCAASLFCYIVIIVHTYYLRYTADDDTDDDDDDDDDNNT